MDSLLLWPYMADTVLLIVHEIDPVDDQGRLHAQYQSSAHDDAFAHGPFDEGEQQEENCSSHEN